MMEFLDNVVWGNILRSIKAAFLEVEKAMFTVVSLVPMFAIITPVSYTRRKISNSFYARCNFKVNRTKNCLRLSKIIVWVLQISVILSDIYGTWFTCFCKLLMAFQDYCLFNMSDQLAVRIGSSWFWLINYRNIGLCYSMTIKQYFCGEE